jgi:hypothetical protein
MRVPQVEEPHSQGVDPFFHLKMNSLLLVLAVSAKNFVQIGGNGAMTTDPEQVEFSFKMAFQRKAISKVGEVGSIGADLVASTLVGSIGMGTPPQTLGVLFDTGSSLFWVRGSTCKTTECVGKKSFDNSKSSTYTNLPDSAQLNRTIRYGDGTLVSCQINQDSLTLGSKVLKNQNVCEADSIITEVASTDGIIGIGPPGAASGTRGADVFSNLLNQSSSTEATIAMWYNLATKFGPGEAGEITFGGVDPSRYEGNITYYDLSVDRTHWQLQVSGISINGGANLMSRTETVLLDSGTTLVYLPSEVLRPIVENFSAQKVTGQQFYLVDCNRIQNAKSISFQFSNGPPVTLTPEQMIFRDSQSRSCILIFADDSNSIGRPIIGALFLRNFYTIYDYGKERIGLAKSKQVGSAGIAIPSFTLLFLLTSVLMF